MFRRFLAAAVAAVYLIVPLAADALTQSELQEALANAVRVGDASLVAQTIASGAKAAGRDASGQTMVQIAIGGGGGDRVSVLRDLLSHGAVLTNSDVFNVLLATGASDQSDLLNYVAVGLHRSLDATDAQGDTFPFVRAVTPESLDYLTSHGLNVNHQNHRGETALTYILKQNGCVVPTASFSALIQHGANPNIKDNSGHSAADYALLHACSDVLAIFRGGASQ